MRSLRYPIDFVGDALGCLREPEGKAASHWWMIRWSCCPVFVTEPTFRVAPFAAATFSNSER